MSKTYSLDDNSVIVVIGSGAGGGTLSNALARQGIDVVCLEAGRRLEMADIINDEAEMFGKLTWLDERIGQGDALAGFPTWTCKTVGGTTMHWTAACPRLQAHEMQARTSYGNVENTSLVDWPFPLSELDPYYDRAENMMGVTGTHNIERLPGNNNYLVLEAGARKVGYKDIDTNNMAINSAPRDGRPGCQQLGFCSSGCAVAAKWSTLYTEISKAELTGHFELRPECMAVKLNTNKHGRVSSVLYLDRQGKLQEQKARLVCVAGNVVETTRLLLNSKTSDSPAGLANSSGELGRNYMRHALAAVVGLMPGEVHLYKGAQFAGVVKDETRHDSSRGFVGGFQITTVPFTPEFFARNLPMRKWGKKFASVLDNYRNFAALMIMGEDPPQADNRITLHPTKKDHYGLPVPVVTYNNHPNTIAMINYGVQAGHKIYAALGAKEIYDLVNIFPGTHNMGTARIGNDPKTSVCNPWGQSHDINNLFISDGSFFPTVGCENPTLTIVAMTLRQADYLVGQLKQDAV